jgi:ribosome-associated protein
MNDKMRALLRDCDVEAFIASGPGGQHRNTSKTAIRLFHRPTGLTAQATERRSQAQNKSAALKRLQAKIDAANEEVKERIATEPSESAKHRRLDEKKKTSQKKADRRWQPED